MDSFRPAYITRLAVEALLKSLQSKLGENMMLTVDDARNSVLSLVKYKTPVNLSFKPGLGSIYLRCIGCNSHRFTSIDETRGNDSKFWCDPCSKKAFDVVKIINDKSEDLRWKSLGELFMHNLYK